jgi:hypothetical protein
MPNLDQIKDVIVELISTEDISTHICFFGGAMPYILENQQSGREHSDIDVLVDENYMSQIRQIAQQKYHYMPNQDSIVLGLDRDYGFKIFIGNVYVEFEPISIKDGIFTHRSFSLNSKNAGEQQIPFDHIEDIMVPIELDGIKTFAQSKEMIRASKSEVARPKDLADIEFIDACGINQEKYERIQKALSNRTLNIFSYEDRVM